MKPLLQVENMLPQWKVYYEELEKQLSHIEQGSADVITKIKLSISSCRSVVDSLKAEINRSDFPSPEDEIYFFKEVKPAFYGHLIYYMKLFNLENRTAHWR